MVRVVGVLLQERKRAGDSPAVSSVVSREQANKRKQMDIEEYMYMPTNT